MDNDRANGIDSHTDSDTNFETATKLVTVSFRRVTVDPGIS